MKDQDKTKEQLIYELAELRQRIAELEALGTERKRAEEALRQRATQLALVNQVARQAASILELDQLLQEVVTAIQQSFNYHHVGFFLLNEVAGELKMQAIAGGFADIAPPGHRLALGEGIVGWTAKTGQSFLANDVSQEPRYVLGILNEALTKSELCVPLKLAGQVIGVLDIQSGQLNAFDETDLMAMKTLADQIAVAIENAKLYQETVRRLKEAETLGAVTTTLTRSLDLDQVLQAVVDSASRLIPVSTNSVIHLVDETVGKLIPRATSAPGINIEEKLGMSIGEGIAGLVVQGKRLINVPNVEEDPRFLTTDTAISKKSLLTVPLMMDGDCIGTLSLNSDQVGVFDADDEWLLTTLAAQAAIAVRNARLFEEAQREIAERKRVEEMLRESQQLLERTFASLRDAIFIIDADTVEIMDCNPAASEIFGYSRDEMLGRTTGFMHVSEAALEEFRGHLYPAVEEKCFLFLPEFAMKRQDGTVFPTEHSVMPLEDERGKRIGWVSVVRDITERKRAEEALRESEERFRSAFEDGPVGMAIVGLDYRLLKVNRAFCEMLGYTEQELAALTFVDITHPEDVEKDVQLTEQVFKGEIPSYKLEKRYITKNQEILWIDLTATVIRDQDGKALYGLAMVENITERKRAEEALRESEASYRELADSIADVFFAMDEDLRYTYWNKASEELTGIAAKDAIGKSLYEVFPDIPETRRAERAYLDVLRTQQPQTFVSEYPLGGKDFIFEISAYPSKRGLSVFVRDITERKRAEETLRESEERFRMVLESSMDNLYRRNLKTDTYDYMSPAVERILGYSVEEILSMPLESVVSMMHPDDIGRVKRVMGESMTSDRAAYLLEYRFRHKDGQYRWLSDLFTVVRDAQGRPLYFVGNVRDITERKRAEEEITQHRKDLQRLSAQLIHAQEAERKRISQELHDEMGQALTAMSINLAAIEKELPPELAPTIRERLAETSSLADQTLEQVRELSLDLRPSMLDDLGLVPTLRWYVNRYAQRLSIEVEFEAIDLEERLSAEMETALYRVVQEALTNIARHARANMVRIRLERKESKVCVLIEDDGQGFDAEEVAGYEALEHGAGLLGIKERVTSLGGKVSIRSRPGQGTRLTIEIPLPL